MGNFLRVCIAVILILSIFTVSVFATPTGTYDLYSFDGRTIVGGSGSGNAYIGNFTRSLAYIHSLLNNISTTIDYYLPNMNNNLHYIHVALVDAFSPGAGDGRSMWQLTSAAVSSLTAIQSAALGIAQDVYNISTYVDGIEGKLDTLHSDNISSNSKLDTLHSDLTTINTNIDEVETKLGTTNTLLYNTNSSLTSINSNTDQIEGYVDGIESSLGSINSNLQSLESINWSNFTNFSVQYSYDNINYYDNISDLTGRSSDFYIKFRGSFSNNSLFNFNFPIYTNNNYKQHPIYLDIYTNDEEIFNNFTLYQNVESLSVFINPFTLFYYNNLYYTVFHFYSDVSINYISNRNITIRNIDTDKLDYYDIASYIELTKLNDNNSELSDIKNILIDIDNNSDFIQNNNDLEINVDIDATDGVAITGVINKLKTLFSTGVGLSQFLLSLNEFDNLLWFTSLETYQQVNYNPNVPGNGYQDLYD